MCVGVKPRKKMISKPSYIKTGVLNLPSKTHCIFGLKPGAGRTDVITDS